MGDVVTVLGADGVVRYANAAVGVLGWRPEDIVGRNFLDFLHPDEIERALQVLDRSNRHGAMPVPSPYRFRAADGSWTTLEILGANIDGDTTAGAFVVVLRRSHDAVVLTEIVNALIAGTDTATLLQLVVDLAGWSELLFRCAVSWEEVGSGVLQAGDPLPPRLAGADLAEGGPWADVAADGTERVVGRADLPTAHAADAEAAGVHAGWILPVPDPRATRPALFTVWTRVPDVDVAVAQHTATAVRQVMALILRWRAQQAELAWSASHDGLTGLWNRAGFFDHLGALDGSPSAVVHIDLDGFKPVNDRHGHLVGDALLADIAGAIVAASREGDIVARLGGDEFAVLCPGGDLATAAAVGDRLLELLARPRTVLGVEVRVGASIGVAAGPAAERLLEEADHAQISAKRTGGAAVHRAGGPVTD